MDIGEASQTAVGGQVIGGDHHAAAVFDGEDGGAGDDWRLGVGCWAGVGAEVAVGEVGGVVGAVDFVAGLEDVLVRCLIGRYMCLDEGRTLPQACGKWFILSRVCWG